MTDKPNDCGIGIFGSGKESCSIAETNVDNADFYGNQRGKNQLTEIFFSAGQDNEDVFCKFAVKIGIKTIRYWIHPSINWLRLFCKTGSVSLVDPGMKVLAVFDLNKADLIDIISQVPQCKDWFKGDFE